MKKVFSGQSEIADCAEFTGNGSRAELACTQPLAGIIHEDRAPQRMDRL